jgi:hypothetical protein
MITYRGISYDVTSIQEKRKQKGACQEGCPCQNCSESAQTRQKARTRVSKNSYCGRVEADDDEEVQQQEVQVKFSLSLYKIPYLCYILLIS